MNVYFGNQQIISDSQQIDELRDASQPIKIDFFMDDLYGYYLLIMYDIDAPYPENNKMSPFIHYLIANIPGTESTPEAGEIVYKYVPPSPPNSSDPHRYIISIYKQPGPVDVEPTNSIMHRQNFPIDQFVTESGLTLVDSAMFTFGYKQLRTSTISPRSSIHQRRNNSPLSPYQPLTPNNSPVSPYQQVQPLTPNNSPLSPYQSLSTSFPSSFLSSSPALPYQSLSSSLKFSPLSTSSSLPYQSLRSSLAFPPSSTSSLSGSSTSASTSPTSVSRRLSFNQPSDKSSWFKSNTSLTEDEQKYCRCTIKAASKQPDSCLVERAWYQTRDGQTCANPYAVCAKSVGVSTKECGDNYNFESMPDHYLRTYILMMYNTMIKRGVVIPSYINDQGVTLPIELDRQQMLDIIHQYKGTY